jgi:uncharacterized membrane protein (UPF0127 family)
MKKLIAVYIILIIAVILLAVFKAGSIGSMLHLGGASAEVSGTKINLTIAKSDKDKQKGLSGRKSLGKNEGMLFVFDSKGNYPFWMKGMKFPIDIIFLSDSNVVDVYNNVPLVKENTPTGLIPTYAPHEPANYTLELNAGTAEKLNIKKGSKITLKGL